MSKQIQILDSKLKKTRKSALDKRIEELKKLLRKVHQDYYKKIYYILKEIIEIRKKQMEGYGQHSLSKEKGIDLTPHQISYIFGYKYISGFTMNEIEKGNIKVSTVLFIIRQNIKFREANYQNKVVKMYLNGKLNTTELSRLGAEIIIDNVIFDKEVTLANKQLIRFTYSIQEMMKKINSKENLFSDRKTLIYLKNQAKRFIDLLEHLEKFGENYKK